MYVTEPILYSGKNFNSSKFLNPKLITVSNLNREDLSTLPKNMSLKGTFNFML